MSTINDGDRSGELRGMGDIDRALGDHNARLIMLEKRAAEDRQHFDGRLRDIISLISDQSSSLAQIQSKQDEAAGARREQARWLKAWLMIIGVVIPLASVLVDIIKWHAL